MTTDAEEHAQERYALWFLDFINDVLRFAVNRTDTPESLGLCFRILKRAVDAAAPPDVRAVIDDNEKALLEDCEGDDFASLVSFALASRPDTVDLTPEDARARLDIASRAVTVVLSPGDPVFALITLRVACLMLMALVKSETPPEEMDQVYARIDGTVRAFEEIDFEVHRIQRLSKGGSA
jgi:hypothetical protein